MSSNNFKLALRGDLSQLERVAWRVVVVVCAIYGDLHGLI